MLALFFAVFASSVPIQAPASSCEMSARWRQLDESVLDLKAPPGTEPVLVTIGCRFLGVPGAIADIDAASTLRGLTVLGIRRGSGQVYLAATPRQASELRRQSTPVKASLVRDGDWRRLVDAFERIPW